MVVSSEVGVAKPDPAIFRCAANAVQTSRRNCVYVGDQPDSDAEAAMAAGLHGVWLDRGLNAPEPQGPATPTVDSLIALADRYGRTSASRR